MTTKMKPKSKIPAAVRAWTPEERFAFSTGTTRYRAGTIPAKTKPKPSKREWD